MCGLRKQVSLNKSVKMAARKYIYIQEAVWTVYNDDSGNELISQLTFNNSKSNVIICGDVQIWETVGLLENVSPNYCSTPHDFTPAAGFSFNTERTKIMSVVNLFNTDELLEYISKQTNLYAGEVIYTYIKY